MIQNIGIKRKNDICCLTASRQTIRRAELSNAFNYVQGSRSLEDRATTQAAAAKGLSVVKEPSRRHPFS